MIVTHIQAEGFMAYQKLDLELPERGLVVVTGRNWQGKSALSEAIAVALWGKTLRGASPWRTGERGEVFIHTADGLNVTRRVSKGGSKKLTWHRDAGGEGPTWPTSAKAQEALLDEVGPFDVWRKTSIFSAHDAALFTEATDKERKQLLESLLGIDRFDVALKACREDAKTAARKNQDLTFTLERHGAVLEEREKRRVEALTLLDQEGPEETDVGALEVRLGKVSATAEEYVDRREVLRAEIEENRDVGADERASARLLEQQIGELAEGICPTCSRSVPTSLVDRLRKRAEKEKAAADRKAKAAQKKLDALRKRLDAINVDYADASAKQSQISAQIVAATQEERRAKAAAKVIAEVQSEIFKAAKVVEVAQEELAESDREVAELRACEQVLGLRGVRAQILGGSLSGLEAIANANLSRIAHEEGAAIALKPYAELKGGGTADSITLEVKGWGGGEHGYKAVSGGARRLINLSLLLGLAEIADAARGREPGDLILDEVLDTLDEERLAAVAEIVKEIARERKVIVITHNQALVEHLEPGAALRIKVEDHEAKVLFRRTAA